MKKILFPTDFSETANNAFVYALRIAAKLDATILTVHAYELPDIKAAHLPNTLKEVYDSIDLEEFENYRDKVPVLYQIAQKEGYGNIEVAHLMLEGKPSRIIPSIAREEDVDMIIMGTKGAGWLKEMFIGSVAGEVLENAWCPVLAIPKNARFDGRIDKIGITISFAEEEERAVRQVLDWARNFKAEVFGINVDISHTEAIAHRMEKWRSRFAKETDIHFVSLEGTDLMRSLSLYVEENSLDMLAMVTHKRSFLEELFNYSKAKKMSYQTQVPILSIQAHTLATAKS